MQRGRFVKPSLAFYTVVLFVMSITILCAQTSVEAPAPKELVHVSPDAWSAKLGTEMVEMFRLIIVNDKGGEISASKDGGKTWTQIGKVLRYCEKTEPKGYTASKWVTPVHVAATAVNALHITTDYDPVKDLGTVFSIIPKEINTGNTSFLSPQAAIETDIRAGTGIFGGGWAPLVGNRIWVERKGVNQQAERGYVPARGDIITIIVERYAKVPAQVVFENHPGGVIWMQMTDGSRTAIGYVVRSVHGVGRFIGGIYADTGRIRANHAGVIDVTCSKLGELAGFQIIPVGHAHSPEMFRALTMTQWMVIAPLSPQQGWEGIAPLFYQFIRPDYSPNDLYSDNWRERLLSRFLAEVRHGDGPWAPMPAFSLDPDMNKAFPDWANHALDDVTAVRILFPIYGDQVSGIPPRRAGRGQKTAETKAPAADEESEEDE
jgi:hypothetical protein